MRTPSVARWGSAERAHDNKKKWSADEIYPLLDRKVTSVSCKRKRARDEGEVLKRRTTNLCYDRLENRQKRELEPSFEPRENEGGPHSVWSHRVKDRVKQEPRDLMTFMLIRILLRLLLQYRFRESSKKIK